MNLRRSARPTRRSRTRAPRWILAIAAALTLAACGDEDGGDSELSAEQEEIADVITTSVTSTDPADCTRLLTQAFVEQAQFETGAAAVQACEEEAPDTSDDPDSVEVSEVVVDGTTATADVSFTGSVLDGSTVTVALVREGEQWKLDRLEDIPEFNREGFQSAFAEQLPADEDVPPEIADCIVSELEQASDEEIKAAFLSGDQQQLVGLFAGCVPGAS